MSETFGRKFRERYQEPEEDRVHLGYVALVFIGFSLLYLATGFFFNAGIKEKSGRQIEQREPNKDQRNISKVDAVLFRLLIALTEFSTECFRHRLALP